MGGSAVRSETVRRHYEEHSHITRATRPEQVFKQSKMNPLFDPSKIKLPREACDSAECPNSRGIIFAEDVTGSMGSYLLNLIQVQFPKLIKATNENVSFDPHIMFMGVGDVEAGDEAPLQVTQFEADLRMIEQLQQIYLEKHGGSNFYESYILPWYFAGKHIHMDCFEKRGEKGFLFTFGDEEPTPHLTRSEIQTVFGDNSSIQTRMITAEECLKMASEKFYCYHIMIGSNYREVSKWKELMGSRACELTNHTYMSELVTTILRMYEGETKTEAINRLKSSEARRVVERALMDHEEVVEIATISKPSDGNTIEVF